MGGVSPGNVSLVEREDVVEVRAPDSAEVNDYMGQLLFVFGLVFIYAIAILTLIISMIRGSRAEEEVLDYLRDLEYMRKKARKRASTRSGLGSIISRISIENTRSHSHRKANAHVETVRPESCSEPPHELLLFAELDTHECPEVFLPDSPLLECTPSIRPPLPHPRVVEICGQGNRDPG